MNGKTAAPPRQPVAPPRVKWTLPLMTWREGIEAKFCATFRLLRCHVLWDDRHIARLLAELRNLGARNINYRVQMSGLLLKRTRKPDGLIPEDFGVMCEGKVVGRIFHDGHTAGERPWFWGLAYGYHDDRTPTHGYEPTREAAMAAFRKGWESRVALRLVFTNVWQARARRLREPASV